MPSPPALDPKLRQALLGALDAGWTVLTANQRAARTLHRAFDLHQRASGLIHWQPPTILAFETWLVAQYNQLLIDGHAEALLLSPPQQHTLWISILASDPALTASLRPIDSLAELAVSAFALLHDYRARPRLAAAADTADTRAFARWAAAFDRLCSRNSYLIPAQLPELLLTALAPHHLTLPTGILLVGFDRQTPAQSTLFEALHTTGVPIESLLLTPPPNSTQTLVSAPTEHDELTAAARWLRTQLTANPSARLALILPTLDPIRHQLDRTLRHILAPELEVITAPAHTGPYEFSLGVPLAHTPLVATALDLLRWCAAPLSIDRITTLLLSPHLAATTPDPSAEHLARAEFDAFVLRQQTLLRPELSLEALTRLVARSSHTAALPTLLNRLRTLLRSTASLASSRSHTAWASVFHDLLAAAGWPSTHLDSTEFQTLHKWHDALDDLASLDFNSPPIPFAAALAALERIAAHTLFAPESRHAPIQIMGPLESAGSTFDAIWFLRAADLTWPIASSPNPLLPFHLQRDLGMPGAGPTLEADFARHITQRIAASAPNVLFSFAAQSSGPDSAHQRPSPALTNLPLEPLTPSAIAPAGPAPEPIPLESLPDDIPIPPPPDRVLPGGASILEAQAACAFRAFAEKRLFSTPLDAAPFGLDPMTRGTLVHSVLEHLWGELETQAALDALSPSEREAALLYSIDYALARVAPSPAPGWPAAYLATERHRILNLLLPWLALELARPPFRVQSRELQLRDVAIGPLRLNVRVDRIDIPLTNKSGPDPTATGPVPQPHILLDYKTGEAKPAQWLTDRPEAPQLPLYAVVSQPAPLAAIAFAQLRAGKDLCLTGYEAVPGILRKAAKLPAPSLADQVEDWRAVLTNLASSFHSGDARVAPRAYPATCKHCAQRLLCRLDPATLTTLADEDSEDTEDALTGQDLTEADLG